MNVDKIPAQLPERASAAAPHPAKAEDAPAKEHAAREARERTARLILGGVDGGTIPEFKRYTLSIHMTEDTNRIVVQVIDPETKQVVRTVPPEDVVRALRDQTAPGALVDEQA
jgi:uncharacterized FlaG/YvyC family protein